MTALAASLFALAALVSGWAIAATLRRYGHAARSLRAQLAACPVDLIVSWTQVERVSLAPLASIRSRPARRTAQPMGLEWSQPGRLAA